MHYSPLLHVLDAYGDLTEGLGNLAFIGTFFCSLTNILVELLTVAVFHEQVDVLFIFEKVFELDYIGALELYVYRNFLLDPLSELLVPEILFVDNLECIYFVSCSALDLVHEGSRASS